MSFRLEKKNREDVSYKGAECYCSRIFLYRQIVCLLAQSHMVVPSTLVKRRGGSEWSVLISCGTFLLTRWSWSRPSSTTSLPPCGEQLNLWQRGWDPTVLSTSSKHWLPVLWLKSISLCSHFTFPLLQADWSWLPLSLLVGREFHHPSLVISGAASQWWGEQ